MCACLGFKGKVKIDMKMDRIGIGNETDINRKSGLTPVKRLSSVAGDAYYLSTNFKKFTIF